MTSPVYAGMVEHPAWGVSLRKGQHEGLIDAATFQTIQRRRVEDALAPARKDIDADFPLRGFVVCAECERPLTAA